MTTTTDRIQDKTDNDLVLRIAGLKAQIAAAKEQLERAEWELQQRLEARGATALAHEHYDVRLEATYILSVEELRARVGELIPPGEWARAVTEEHEQTITIGAKADARVVNTWKKYGAEVAAGIEAAKIPDKTRLKISEKR